MGKRTVRSVLLSSGVSFYGPSWAGVRDNRALFSAVSMSDAASHRLFPYHYAIKKPRPWLLGRGFMLNP